jgi:hypothetical protein
MTQKPPIVLLCRKIPLYPAVIDIQWSRSSWYITNGHSERYDLWFHVGRSQPKEKDCSLYHLICLNIKITLGVYL